VCCDECCKLVFELLSFHLFVLFSIYSRVDKLAECGLTSHFFLGYICRIWVFFKFLFHFPLVYCRLRCVEDDGITPGVPKMKEEGNSALPVDQHIAQSRTQIRLFLLLLW